ncbi:MAG: Fur family transcriptional regulator [Dehalococcoidia bacterium]
MESPSPPIADRLRRAGLRVTPQRRAIWDAFAEAGYAHLTAEEVHARAQTRLPELSRATVYNTLGELVRTGILHTVPGSGAVRYDPDPDLSHQHFRCLTCDDVFDIDVSGHEDVVVRTAGFRPVRVKLLVEGHCPRCAALAGD